MWEKGRVYGGLLQGGVVLLLTMEREGVWEKGRNAEEGCARVG